MADVDFQFGSLIRTGPKLQYGGKWYADLVDWNKNAVTNADLTIYIKVFFKRIDPAGATGLYGDTDDTPTTPSKKPIQKWKPGEFERFVRNMTTGAQAYWNGRFWLKTPKTYHGLDFQAPNKATYRCNLYCKFELTAATSEAEAHYTIAVVRAKDGTNFRSNSVLYSQADINAEQLIPGSTAKFWTHFHEVGHLIGLGHVGTGGVTNVHNDNSNTAYGVTSVELHDVMGKGHSRHNWHATPWREAAEAFTKVPKDDWKVHQTHILPERI